MGNGSSRGSADYNYPFPPIPGPHVPVGGPQMQQQPQMPIPFQQQQMMMPQPNPYHPGSGSHHTGSVASYDYPMKRHKKHWYSLGRRKNKYRANDLWYQNYVSPTMGGPVIPPPPAGVVYNPATAWGAPHAFVPQGQPDQPRFGGVQFPGNAVIPENMISPNPDPQGWHQRRQHHVQQQQQQAGPQMSMPQPQTQQPPMRRRTASPRSPSSPPFKPFEPLPPSRAQRPPTPPPNIYKNSFSHLMHPTPATHARVIEIIDNPQQTSIEQMKEQWRKQDEEREKQIQERREQRNKLLNGALPIAPQIVQSISPVSTEPPPPPKPKKTRKSLFDSLFRRRDDQNPYTDSNTANQPPARAVIPSAHMMSSTTSRSVSMPTPSPYLSSPLQAMGSTTPPFSPPNQAEITATNKYADFLPMSSHPVSYAPDAHENPFKAETWPTAAHLYLASKYIISKPSRAKKIRKTPILNEVLRLVEGGGWDGDIRQDWDEVKTNMLEDIMYLKFHQYPELARLLIGTGNLQLVCNVQHPILRDHSFGALLMRVRERLVREGNFK